MTTDDSLRFVRRGPDTAIWGSVRLCTRGRRRTPGKWTLGDAVSTATRHFRCLPDSCMFLQLKGSSAQRHLEGDLHDQQTNRWRRYKLTRFKISHRTGLRGNRHGGKHVSRCRSHRTVAEIHCILASSMRMYSIPAVDGNSATRPLPDLTDDIAVFLRQQVKVLHRRRDPLY